MSVFSTHTADFERKTTTLGTGGGQVSAFAVVYDDVAGTLQPVSGETRERFLRESMTVSHVFYTQTAIALLAGDRAVISSANYIVQWGEDQAGRGEVYAAWLMKTD
jgi:hypothetical protein